MAKDIDDIDNDLKNVTLDKETSANKSRKAIFRKSHEKARIASALTSEQDFEGARSAYLEACELLDQYKALVTAPEVKQQLEKIVRLRVSSSD